MFASSVEQSIVNLICFYEVFGHIKAQDVKESWIELLLCLDIFDYKGRPLCRFWTDDDCVNEWSVRKFHHDGQVRCCHYLGDNNEGLSRAFRQFYIDASDPLIERHGDSALLNAIITFATHACCVEHKQSRKRMEVLAGELLPIVKAWRRRYVFCELPDPPLVEDVEVDPVGRMSGIFSRRLRKPKKHQRSRSASPSSDGASPPAPLELLRPLRPMSSAYDILKTPRRSASNASDWDVTERGRRRKTHFQALLKSTGLGYGRSAARKARPLTTGRPLSTILAGGSHDSMTHRFSSSARID